MQSAVVCYSDPECHHFYFYLYFSKFYEREALLRDPVDGPILASLLGISFDIFKNVQEFVYCDVFIVGLG